MLSPSSGTLFPSTWQSLLCYLLHGVPYSLQPGKVCYVISFIGNFIPFNLAKSAMLSPSSGTLFPSTWQSLLCYLLHRVLYSLQPGKVCYVIFFIGNFIPFNLAKSAMLSPSSGTLFPSTWQSLLCYLLHRVLYSLQPGKVCYGISFMGYFIPFNLAKSAMLSPSSGTLFPSTWQSLLCYLLHGVPYSLQPGKVCYLLHGVLYSLQPGKVCYVISFIGNFTPVTLAMSAMLSPSSGTLLQSLLQSLLCYLLRRELYSNHSCKVCYVISFIGNFTPITLAMSAMLSPLSGTSLPSPPQALSSCPLPSNQICSPVPVSLTRCAVLHVHLATRQRVTGSRSNQKTLSNLART